MLALNPPHPSSVLEDTESRIQDLELSMLLWVQSAMVFAGLRLYRRVWTPHTLRVALTHMHTWRNNFMIEQQISVARLHVISSVPTRPRP
jgi:hypothetical protein